MLPRLIGEDIELEFVAGSMLGKVKADPVQIEEVLINLVANSRDAMPKGGRLVIETANVRLDEAYAEGHSIVPPGEYVLLAVTDSGQGIAPDICHTSSSLSIILNKKARAPVSVWLPCMAS
jgi:signal transduction histidine kinase